LVDFIFLPFSLFFNFIPFFLPLLSRRGYQTLLLCGPLPLIWLGLVRNITPPSSQLLESQIWDATEHMMQSKLVLLSLSDALLCSTRARESNKSMWNIIILGEKILG
jgi:hypothetical protein